MAQENTPLSLQDQLGVLNTLERDKAHAQTKLFHEKRLAENPVPTEEELRVGTYREFLEPQIRDAIFVFNNKGYYTIDSGYHGRKILEGVQSEHWISVSGFSKRGTKRKMVERPSTQISKSLGFSSRLTTRHCANGEL